MEAIGGVNIFVCPTCQKGLSTVNLSAGLILEHPKCVLCNAGFMTSLQYVVVPPLVERGAVCLTITHCWYRPKELTPETEDWLLNGGLVLGELEIASPARPDPTRAGTKKVEFLHITKEIWGVECEPDFQTQRIRRKNDTRTSY